MSHLGTKSMPLSLANVTREMAFGEFISQAFAAFRADKVRATMTALGMVIGTSSLILVVTVALSGKAVRAGADREHRHQPGLGGVRRPGQCRRECLGP